jgi:hypothetical protein
MIPLLDDSVDVVEGNLIIFETRISHLGLEIHAARLANSIPIAVKIKLER